MMIVVLGVEMEMMHIFFLDWQIGYHPEFDRSRCLFIVRKDGELVDFSYWKCIKGLIRKNYPLYADSFILRHFRRHRRSVWGSILNCLPLVSLNCKNFSFFIISLLIIVCLFMCWSNTLEIRRRWTESCGTIWPKTGSEKKRDSSWKRLTSLCFSYYNPLPVWVPFLHGPERRNVGLLYNYPLLSNIVCIIKFQMILYLAQHLFGFKRNKGKLFFRFFRLAIGFLNLGVYR